MCENGEADAISADNSTSNTLPGHINSLPAHSQLSNDSQTAADFIRDQEALEADAREALPYSIENCTKILGPLRQNVFACLTCNPAPSDTSESWTPAGVCYACSIQCHGEHTLVEIFQKRNFTCDCGTTRIPETSPCALRTNDRTNTRGEVHSELPDANNKYNHNFRNRFCGCECDYDPFQQKGTMFQCFGLGTEETGGCGEDWYHPGCIVGMGPQWFDKMKVPKQTRTDNRESHNGLAVIAEDNDEMKEPTEEAEVRHCLENLDEEEPPMPPGFPDEDEFDGFICYKCVESQPWIKRYVSASGFLPPVFLDQSSQTSMQVTEESSSKKRKADAVTEDQGDLKRVRSEITEPRSTDSSLAIDGFEESKPSLEDSSFCKFRNLPAPQPGRFSIFFREGFRDSFCRCSDCYRKLNAHPQLLEEEEAYEPPISEDGESQHGGSTHGSGSLLDRGETALRNVDRVRAIEGVMAYNHLKEQLKPFFQQFAESGKAIGAEDIKAYFAKLRGDDDGTSGAREATSSSTDNNGSDEAQGSTRREQDGY